MSQQQPQPQPPVDPTLELPAAERELLEIGPPVDPWAEAEATQVAGPYPPTLPYPQPPPAPPPPPAASPVPHRPRPLGADRPPAGWRPPPGYVVVAVRRRRRWPWVMLALTLLMIGCCCGVPAYLGKPIWEQYPAAAALPDQIADLQRRDDAASQRTGQRLKQEMRAAHLLAEETFAGIYSDPAGKQVTVFGATGFRLRPDEDINTEVARLTPVYGLTDQRTIDTGTRGDHVSCGTGRLDDTAVVACTWADHGSLGTALFTRFSIDDSPALLAELRSAILTRG